MIDKQPIQYNTHVFKYLDKDKNLLRALPGRWCSSRESAESMADKGVEYIQKIDLTTRKIVDFWSRDEFTYGNLIMKKEAKHE